MMSLVVRVVGLIYTDTGQGGLPAFIGMGYNLLAGSSTTFTPVNGGDDSHD